MTTAHAYLRVSTDRQTCAHQEREVCALMRAIGQPGPRIVREVESGARARPKLRELVQGLRAGDVLAVWALDRLGRSALEMVNAIRTLLDRGVRVVSVQEPWIDQGGAPVRDLLLFVFAWVAEQERRRLIERTRAGLATARAAGKTLGRPSQTDPAALARAARGVLRGSVTVAWAATLNRVPRTTLRRYLAKTVANAPQGKQR